MKPVEIFISFHAADEGFYKELEKHLSALKREEIVHCWSHRKILAGSERDTEIDKQLNQADIILLLISPDFLDSDYHWTVEVTRALERHESGRGCSIIVLTRFVDWETPPINRLPVLPKNRTPIKKWEDHDEALKEVVDGIREELLSLSAERVGTLDSESMVVDEELADQITLLINEGDKLHQKNDLEEAASRYKAALSLDPNNVLAHHNLGFVLAKQNKLDEAIAEFEQTIHLNPNDVDAHFNLGNALRKQGKLGEAIMAYEKALALDPDDVDTLCNLGNVLRIQGKLDEAVSNCRAATLLEPKNAVARSALGNALKEKGELEKAIAEYQIAVQLEPKNATIHYNLASILDEQSNLEDAVLEYKKAAKLNPNYAKYRYYLGSALDKQGNIVESISQYKKTISLDPKYAIAHHDLGIALNKQGNNKQAIKSIKKAIEIEPNNTTFQKNLRALIQIQKQISDSSPTAVQTIVELTQPESGSHGE